MAADIQTMYYRVFAALVALTCTLAGADAPARKPNVLFICVDDLKPVLGCYGDQQIKSPNIDRLSTRGVLFERAYCNQAVCAPSRNALMTGLRPTTLGIYDLGTNFREARPDAVTMAQYFKQQGWRTEAMGKIFHVGHGNHEDPASWSVPHWTPRLNGMGGGYVLPENRPPQRTREEALFSNANVDASKLPRGAATEGADVADNAYSDGMIADEAIRRLEQARSRPNQPFFMAVGFHKPHLPFVAPKKYWDMYSASSFELPKLQSAPEGAPAFAPTSWGELRNYSDIPRTGPITDDTARHLIHGYYAAVSYMDAQLGRVISALDRLELAKNTIVVMWGDHGWHLGDHGMWCKHSNYEQANRIPLLVVKPGIAKADARSKALVETVDIYPTLCELAGIPIPQGLDGRSFGAALRDPDAPGKQAVFHSYPRSPRGMGELVGRAVRTERYRLVEWKKPGAAPETAVIELYDYMSDPGETKNLAEEQANVVAEMRKILAGQPEARPQFRALSPAARTDRESMFARRDKDNDGRLTREEFLANQPDPDQAPRRWEQFDVNRDGFLDKEEFVTMGKLVK